MLRVGHSNGETCGTVLSGMAQRIFTRFTRGKLISSAVMYKEELGTHLQLPSWGDSILFYGDSMSTVLTEFNKHIDLLRLRLEHKLLFRHLPNKWLVTCIGFSPIALG